MTDSSPEHCDGGELVSSTQTSKDSAGRLLLAAREAAGLSRAELSQRLCIIDNTVEWLESDNYVRQPEAVYARGYIRNICRELSIPVEPVLEAYDRDRPQPEQRSESRRITKAEAFRPERRRGHGALALIPLLLAAGVFWWKYGTPVNIPGMPLGEDGAEQVAESPVANAVIDNSVANGEQVEIQQQEMTVAAGNLGSESAANDSVNIRPEVASVDLVEVQPTSSVATVTEPVPTQVAQLDQALKGALRLRFDEDAWVEVKDAQGVILLAGVQAAGSAKSIDGDAPFELMLGNARATHVVYRDETIDSQPIGDRRTRRLIVGD
ncbi:helix-turn-helix domain-containing protein [Microbulbifer sp. JMSA004]|uniref:helix-turn-helix domain-containing protein n=1 Tax=Microbulbifer sp. JMSA004 TaxID=3243370 RepID=UPI00403A4E91